MLSTKTCQTGWVLSLPVPDGFVLVSWCSRKADMDIQFPSLICSSFPGYAIFTEHFGSWRPPSAEVLRRPQDTDPKRKVTWLRLSICFKRRKLWSFYFVRVVEGKLLLFCLRCFAQLVLQQALHTHTHTDAVEVTVQPHITSPLESLRSCHQVSNSPEAFHCETE